MSDDVTQDYVELLAVLAGTAAELSWAAVRETRRDAQALQERLARAIKSPDWAPKDKAEWDHHTAVVNDEGKTIGYADETDPMVATLDPADGGKPGGEKLLNVGGDAWLAGSHAGTDKELDAVKITTAQYAREWLREKGWSVFGGERGAPEEQAADDAPVLVESGTAKVPDSAREVVVTGGDAQVAETVPVQVPGEGTVNGKQVSGWDELAPEMAEADTAPPDTGFSREEERLIGAGPTHSAPQSPGMSWD
ncbi:hypothetical protein E4P34_09300 [Kocuria rhizophila]|uniref:Uncharacterized protein n=1 Tax=Kocuria rhizophila TaxID=72000 RepID=A0AAX2SEW7_KOCRH|nr:hypothetical protein [Kocuria rhizophila]TFI02163.1 hypothetical protein E4P33_03715 [Kocuria rhizophila]TFI05902.1 hypothetical protein E4P34_09300 [Kocuria rhizophila]